MTADELETAFWQRLDGVSESELLELGAVSPAVHFACFTQILNKQRELVFARPNILQLRMSQVYETCMALGLPCMMVVCKPRQVGCSTFGSHIGYHHSQVRATNGITISDKADNSRKLMLKIRDYKVHDRYPWGTRMRDTAGAIEWTNGSRWEIDSAENQKAGIGDTRQFFHASEVGKWPKNTVKNDQRVMSAVLPSVSKDGSSCIVAESTPEGAVGWMYDTWMKEAVSFDEFLAKVARGERPVVWIRVFAAWFEFREHRKAVRPAEVREMERTLSPREADGIAKYGWDWEQVAWRRDKLSTECGGDEDVLDEYYPEDDERCWAVSGRPRFNMSSLMAMERRAQGRVSQPGFLTLQENDGVSWVRDDAGDFEVWEGPRENLRYLVSCDPATGASNVHGKDPDRSSVLVWRGGYVDDSTGGWVKPALVARVRPPCLWDGDDVALSIVKLSRWYGGALVVLEINQGVHVLQHLEDAGVPLFKREVPSHRPGVKTEQFGFKLTEKEQRRQVVEGLAAAIREEAFDVWCPHWIGEAKAFVTTDSGKDQARHGAHDDDVMCSAMAWLTLPSASSYNSRRKGPRRPLDWKDWRRFKGPPRSY